MAPVRFQLPQVLDHDYFAPMTRGVSQAVATIALIGTACLPGPVPSPGPDGPLRQGSLRQNRRRCRSRSSPSLRRPRGRATAHTVCSGPYSLARGLSTGRSTAFSQRFQLHLRVGWQRDCHSSDQRSNRRGEAERKLPRVPPGAASFTVGLDCCVRTGSGAGIRHSEGAAPRQPSP
jgi:hypothetical protein